MLWPKWKKENNTTNTENDWRKGLLLLLLHSMFMFMFTIINTEASFQSSYLPKQNNSVNWRILVSVTEFHVFICSHKRVKNVVIFSICSLIQAIIMRFNKRFFNSGLRVFPNTWNNLNMISNRFCEISFLPEDNFYNLDRVFSLKTYIQRLETRKNANFFYSNSNEWEKFIISIMFNIFNKSARAHSQQAIHNINSIQYTQRDIIF